MKTYKDAEDIAISDKKKRLKYEQIRISEESKELSAQKEVVDSLLSDID